MIFNPLKCQEIFMTRFTGASGKPFTDFKDGKTIKDCNIDPCDLALYNRVIKDDISSFYYKSLLSFSEGIAAISRKNLSWATVKLYYSVYYGLRCSLLCRQVVILRAGTYLYYIRLKYSTKYERAPKCNDHAATYEIYANLFKTSDFLLSNSLEDNKDVYKWLTSCREIINYKEAVFQDPNISDLWRKIVAEISDKNIRTLLVKYLDEKNTYCFSPDDAILAVPTNRLFTVAQEIRNEHVRSMTNEQKSWVASILNKSFDDGLLEDILV